MSIDNVLAGVAVKDLEQALPWYERVLGRPDKRPMAMLAEWTLPRGGGLQVFADPERAGRSSVTFVVTDLDRQLEALKRGDVAIDKTTSTAAVRTAIVRDPDGNQIVFAQALSDDVAR